MEKKQYTPLEKSGIGVLLFCTALVAGYFLSKHASDSSLKRREGYRNAYTRLLELGIPTPWRYADRLIFVEPDTQEEDGILMAIKSEITNGEINS